MTKGNHIKSYRCVKSCRLSICHLCNLKNNINKDLPKRLMMPSL